MEDWARFGIGNSETLNCGNGEMKASKFTLSLNNDIMLQVFLSNLSNHKTVGMKR
jgi:hypothetical protein